MNQPDRYSRFVLPSGQEEAVEYKPDTKMRSCAQFNIWLEDHTVGNLVRQQLLSNPEVVFAGYRIPHPLTPMMTVRVQTTGNSNPPAAMTDAIEQLRKEVFDIKTQFEKAAPRDKQHLEQQDAQYQQQQQAQQQGYAHDQYGGAQHGYGPVPPGGGYGASDYGGAAYGGGYQPAAGGGGGGYQ